VAHTLPCQRVDSPVNLHLLLLASIAASPAALWLLRRAPSAAPLLAAIPLLLFAAFCSFVPSVLAGNPIETVVDWLPSAGVALAFRVDGWSLLFSLLITGIGSFIFLYASRYLRGDADLPRFFAFLTLFMAAMLGAVLADDLVVLLVFWEATSLASFLLIGYRPEDAAARRSAQQGLLITTAGGLCLLAGAILLGSAAGTFRISQIVADAAQVAAHPNAPVVIVLVALGAFAKSAQVPLHAWLPNAMVAPTPVSAFLHSATMVKLGVYLLARLNPVYGESPVWVGLLSCAGLATVITGAVLALRQTDLKRVLAYSTIVSLGTLVALIALPHGAAAAAVAVFLIVHALYKAALFMVAGIVDHETGTRDTSRLGGLARCMPITAAIALASALSMAGLPPFAGFVAKELLYEASLHSAGSWLPAALALLGNAVMVAVGCVVAVRVFWGPPKGVHPPAHDPPWPMWLGPAVLAVAGVVLGVAPALAGELVGAAALAIAGRSVDVDLKLWHGITPPLALSALTLALGVLVYSQWDRLHRWLAGHSAIERLGPDLGYDRGLRLLQRLAAWQTNRVQTRSLRDYVGRTLAVFALAVLATLVAQGGWAWPGWPQAWTLHAALPFLLVLAAWTVLRAHDFMRGIVAAGLVGFALALVFLFHGAPDLAFTQFSVEAVAVVVLLAIVGRMRFRGPDARPASQRKRDAAIALAVGAMGSALLLSVLATPFDDRLSAFFREASVPLAQGRNLVNVIIVDFRALDTLGEITVLALAAMAAAAVIAGAARRTPRVEEGAQ